MRGLERPRRPTWTWTEQTKKLKSVHSGRQVPIVLTVDLILRHCGIREMLIINENENEDDKDSDNGNDIDTDYDNDREVGT